MQVTTQHSLVDRQEEDLDLPSLSLRLGASRMLKPCGAEVKQSAALQQQVLSFSEEDSFRGLPPFHSSGSSLEEEPHQLSGDMVNSGCDILLVHRTQSPHPTRQLQKKQSLVRDHPQGC